MVLPRAVPFFPCHSTDSHNTRSLFNTHWNWNSCFRLHIEFLISKILLSLFIFLLIVWKHTHRHFEHVRLNSHVMREGVSGFSGSRGILRYYSRKSWSVLIQAERLLNLPSSDFERMSLVRIMRIDQFSFLNESQVIWIKKIILIIYLNHRTTRIARSLNIFDTYVEPTFISSGLFFTFVQKNHLFNNIINLFTSNIQSCL